MLSNMEEKRETLPFLEVSADGGHHRDVSLSRAELSSQLELHPRDLRFLDASMRNLPSILARKKVIIVNLEMFKALITADRVLMSDTWYPHVKEVVAPMQASVLNGGELYDNQPVPFEFIALEHILLTVVSHASSAQQAGAAEPRSMRTDHCCLLCVSLSVATSKPASMCI